VKVAGPSTFRAGVPVRFNGTVRDPEGRRVRARDQKWTVTLYHRDHDHPMAVKRTKRGIKFTPVTDHDADTHYVVSLSAKDRGGAPGSRRVRVRPRTSRVVISTVPSGIPVSFGDSDFQTPFVHRSAVGFRTTIAVPASYTSGGVTYTFARWSDGGARQHDIAIRPSGLGLVARYAGPDGQLVSGSQP
jgi:hypothetical protein